MSNNLPELMASNDVDFVRGAYRLLLKREADPAGEKNYCDLLRAGRARASVLAALVESAEAKVAAADVPGLSRMLRWQRIGQLPVVGRFALALRRLLRPAPDMDPEVAFRCQAMDMQRATLELAGQLLTVAKDLQVRQSGVERTLARMDRRQAEAKRPRN